MLVETDLFFEDSEDANRTFCAVQKHFPHAKRISFEELFALRKVAREPFRGSMALASKMGETFPFANALNWLPALKPFTFARNYKFLDFEQIVHEADLLGVPDKGLFVRPCSGLKEFSGQVFRNKEKLENEFNFVTRNKNISPGLICVVAPAVEIHEEYRCIFVNNQLVDGVMYLKDGERKDGPLPLAVRWFAEAIAAQPYFQNIFDFVIDVGYGKENEGLRVIEINAFETASFYTANLDKIYSAWADSLNNK